MPNPAGEVVLSVTDGGANAAQPPINNLQAIIGCCSNGGTGISATSPLFTTAQFVADITSLKSIYGFGPLVEAAGMVIQGGGTVLAVAAKIASVGFANPTTATHVGTGASVLTITPNDVTVGMADDYQVIVKIISGGTVGTAGTGNFNQFQISLDAGRTFGPTINLGTSAVYTGIGAQTGIVLNFTTATLIAGDTYSFITQAPLWSETTLAPAFVALGGQSLDFGGDLHILGPATGTTDASTIETALDTLANQFRYTRAFLDTQDINDGTPNRGKPTGGVTEQTWMTALENDWAAVTAKRICVSAGWYNMPTAIANQLCGSPRYRRNLSWAAAVRNIQVDPQVHLGRVSDGALKNIVVNPSSDGGDGFLYHDERITPQLDFFRFMSARTRIGFPGFYIANPNLMSLIGSDFSQLQFGRVIDVVCDLTHQNLELQINNTVRVNPSTGFILEKDAVSIENALESVLNANVTNKGACSAIVTHVSRTDNILITKTLTVTVRVTALGYLEEIDVSVGFTNPLLA